MVESSLTNSAIRSPRWSYSLDSSSVIPRNAAPFSASICSSLSRIISDVRLSIRSGLGGSAFTIEHSPATPQWVDAKNWTWHDRNRAAVYLRVSPWAKDSGFPLDLEIQSV